MKKTILTKITFLFNNILEEIYHCPLPNENQLFRKSLFENITEEQFALLKKKIKTKQYLADHLIFHEGAKADALYIIVNGSIRIFSYDNNKKKVPLARLNEGDYFGEQALLGFINTTRNASAETITTCTLLKVEGKTFQNIIKKHNKIADKLKKIGLSQTLATLNSTINFYNQIKYHINDLKNTTLIAVEKSKVLFNIGDKAESVFLILDGEIELHFPNEQSALILKKGHLFGELGVIKSQPRLATAKAHVNSHLLIIEKEEFLSIYNRYPSLKYLFSTIEKFYQLPIKGLIEQYVGRHPSLGPTINHIFKLNDSRTLIAIRALETSIFIIKNEEPSDKSKSYHYLYQDGSITELFIAQNHLQMIKVIGKWNNLANACEAMINNRLIGNKQIQTFQENGELLLNEHKHENVICKCMQITQDSLEKVIIQHNIRDIETITRLTGACSVCKCCTNQILALFHQSVLQEGELVLSEKHSSEVRSYTIKLTKDFPIPIPGQYINIKIKIKDFSISRTYTVSNYSDHSTSMQITIKKIPNGFFSEWLFHNDGVSLPIECGTPVGKFILERTHPQKIICFAGGVGITPFKAFIEAICNNAYSHEIFLIYSASNPNDFIFKSHLSSLADRCERIKIDFWCTSIKGRIHPAIVREIIKRNETNSQVYICGPSGFEQMIVSTLNDLSYPENKVHVECFVHAGEKSVFN